MPFSDANEARSSTEMSTALRVTAKLTSSRGTTASLTQKSGSLPKSFLVSALKVAAGVSTAFIKVLLA